MNWIILIVAGLFETGFTFCLGKMKGASGMEYWLWGAGFLICTFFSMGLLARQCIRCLSGRLIPCGRA